MKILGIVNNYLPNGHANGICLSKIVEDLRLTTNQETYVLTYRKNEEDNPKEIINGVNVVRIKPPITLRLFENYYNFENKTSEFMYQLSRILGKFFSFLFFPFYPLRYPLSSIKLFLYAKLLIEKESIGTIISVYKPYEVVIPGCWLKKIMGSDIQSILYILDTFTETSVPRGFSKQFHDKKMKKIEDKVFSSYDLILLLDNYYDNYLDHPYIDKIFSVGIPLINFNRYKKNKNNNQIEIIYTGSLSQSRRNPQYALNLFQVLYDEGLKFNIDFYSRGDCDKMLADKSSFCTNYGYKEHHYVQSKIFNAHFLLSIGNNNPKMIPSKIYEYISSLKPIIHFVKQDDDMAAKELKKYPLALIIDERESLEYNATVVRNFLINSPNLNESFLRESVEENFSINIPSYTSEIILNKIKKE